MHLADLLPTQHVLCVTCGETWLQLLLNLINPPLQVFAIEAFCCVERRPQTLLPFFDQFPVESFGGSESKGVEDSVVPQNLARSNHSRSDKYRRLKLIF